MKGLTMYYEAAGTILCPAEKQPVEDKPDAAAAAAAENSLPIIMPWRLSFSLVLPTVSARSSSVDGRKGSSCTPWSDDSTGVADGLLNSKYNVEKPELVGVGQQFKPDAAAPACGAGERQLSLSG